MSGWRVAGRFFREILPLRGSILQARTCQILRLAENPSWSLVWQWCSSDKECCYWLTHGKSCLLCTTLQSSVETYIRQRWFFSSRKWNFCLHDHWATPSTTYWSTTVPRIQKEIPTRLRLIVFSLVMMSSNKILDPNSCPVRIFESQIHTR